MAKVIFRLYEELNAYVSADRRKKDFEVAFEGERNLGELMEELGVPCREVDLLLVNGESAGFSHVPGEGDRVSVYPVFEAFNISKVTRLWGRPLRRTKFILDPDLSELAAAMQGEGYDVRFDALLSWGEIFDISHRENRIILTGNPLLLESGRVTHAVLLQRGAPHLQLGEVVEKLDMDPERNLRSPEGEDFDRAGAE
jgi:hypothetical protein